MHGARKTKLFYQSLFFDSLKYTYELKVLSIEYESVAIIFL